MNVAALKNKRKYFAPADLLVIALVLCFVVFGVFMFFYSAKSQSAMAVVKVRGEVTERISLADVEKPYELEIEGECSVVIEVSSDGVRFVHSECPDDLCVNTGLLQYAGQSAVCLPGRVSVTIESAEGSDESVPDAIVG